MSIAALVIAGACVPVAVVPWVLIYAKSWRSLGGNGGPPPQDPLWAEFERTARR